MYYYYIIRNGFVDAEAAAGPPVCVAPAPNGVLAGANGGN